MTDRCAPCGTKCGHSLTKLPKVPGWGIFGTTVPAAARPGAARRSAGASERWAGPAEPGPVWPGPARKRFPGTTPAPIASSQD
ncbi:hypothetical protein GCM10009864_77070 [Streptomyces lunalinharesii]|uniref:Uncharacterized protein n=1 Tax=Streptomyces lunalinharesii TaxID=333384 RepID=A0ABP6FF91_9ACTN